MGSQMILGVAVAASILAASILIVLIVWKVRQSAKGRVQGSARTALVQRAVEPRAVFQGQCSVGPAPAQPTSMPLHPPKRSISASRPPARTAEEIPVRTKSAPARLRLTREQAAVVREAVQQQIGGENYHRIVASLRRTQTELGTNGIAAAEKDLVAALDVLLPALSRKEPAVALPTLPPFGVALGMRDTEWLLMRDLGPDQEQACKDAYRACGFDYSAVQSSLRRFMKDLNLKAENVATLASLHQGDRPDRPDWLGCTDHRDMQKDCPACVELAFKRDQRVDMNVSEQFYATLARGFLGHGVPAPHIRDLGMRFRRAIQGVVLNAHPEWVDSEQLAIDVTTHADVLKAAMAVADGHVGAFLAKLAVCIFNAEEGGIINIFKGRSYDTLDDDAKAQHLILLLRTPGRYHCLVSYEGAEKPSCDVDDLKAQFEANDVPFLEEELAGCFP